MNQKLARNSLLHDFQIPDEIVDRNGYRVSTRGDVWLAHTEAHQVSKIIFTEFRNPYLKYAMQRYIIFCLERHSPITSVINLTSLRWLLNKSLYFTAIEPSDGPEVIQQRLIDAMQDLIRQLRGSGKFYRFSRLRQWYLWCVDYISEYGFCDEFSVELEGLSIPGGPRGEAVKGRDPETGPLHFELEEPLVRHALLNDDSKVFEHLQQRLAVALSLAFGRNTLNFCRLREEDLVLILPGSENEEPVYQLNIPRIKKGGHGRQFFRPVGCSDKLAGMICELIHAGRTIESKLKGRVCARPLFIRTNPDVNVAGGDSWEWAFHIDTKIFRDLLHGWVDRHQIISPITNELLVLTPRRLRYTFGCGMARQGATRAALAEMLDHTDTQHVGVYFTLDEEMVSMLDKALATRIGPLLNWFQGAFVDSDADATNGSNAGKHQFFEAHRDLEQGVEIGVCGLDKICHLDPPYSCYLCPKFQAYRHADHELVLDILLSDRAERLSKYENNRLGVQLDDVIFAVGAVVAECKARNNAESSL